MARTIQTESREREQAAPLGSSRTQATPLGCSENAEQVAGALCRLEKAILAEPSRPVYIQLVDGTDCPAISERVERVSAHGAGGGNRPGAQRPWAVAARARARSHRVDKPGGGGRG